MFGMGAGLTPEQQKLLDERKAEHDANLKAFREAQRLRDIELGIVDPDEDGDEDEDADNAGEAAHNHGHDHEHGHGTPAPDEPLDDFGIDEEAILKYFRTRNEAVEEARRRVRALEAQNQHLTSQLKIANDKVKALQKAIARMRAVSAQAQKGMAAQPQANVQLQDDADKPAAPEVGVSSAIPAAPEAGAAPANPADPGAGR